MKVRPVKYEAYENDSSVFKVTKLYEGLANVEICAAVSVYSWKKISEEILKCLIEMRLGEV